MANNNNPHGFRPLGWCLGGGPPFHFQSLQKAASYGTAIYPFDLVERATGGTIDTTITPGTTLMSGVALDYGGPFDADQPSGDCLGRRDSRSAGR